MTHHVLRWHNNAHAALRLSGDTIDAHQRRVCAMACDLAARLGLPLHGSDLPRAALHHDEAEKVVGDLPGPAKVRFPVLARAYTMAENEVMREMGIAPFDLSGEEWAILKICDKLDAILWAKSHGVTGDEWPHEWAVLRAKALALSSDALAWVQEAYSDPARWVGPENPEMPVTGEKMGACE